MMFTYKPSSTMLSLVESLFEKPLEKETKEVIYSPEYDIDKDETGYIVTVELPGIKKENVDINIESDAFTVSAERNGKKYKQKFVLGKYNDKDSITAKMEDGILEIKVPFKKEVQAKKIEIL